MNLKRSLFWGGIGIAVLIMVSMFLKWPSNIAAGHHNQEVKSKEVIVPASNVVSKTTSTPPLSPNNQDEPKMIKFPKEGIPVLMYHSISTIPGNSLGVPVEQFSEEMQ